MLKAAIEECKKEQISLDEIKRRLGEAFSDSEIKKNLQELTDNGDVTVSNIAGHQCYEFTG